jgi:hypothetical protein
LYTTTQHITTIEKNKPDGLYYMNIFAFADNMDNRNYISNQAVRYQGIEQSQRKLQPNNELSKRVWQFHRGMFHTSLRKLAQMIRSNLISNAPCTVEEINLVMNHQQCPACMLAKTNKRITNPGSGLRSLNVGEIWSEDYQGPFATPAIGGYTGRYIFVECTTGHLIVFLVKSKTELITCIKKLSIFCQTFGKLPRVLRSDPAKVEISNELREKCASINGVGVPGIEIRPAAPEQQNQNPVERYIQAGCGKSDKCKYGCPRLTLSCVVLISFHSNLRNEKSSVQ